MPFLCMRPGGRRRGYRRAHDLGGLFRKRSRLVCVGLYAAALLWVLLMPQSLLPVLLLLIAVSAVDVDAVASFVAQDGT